MKELVQREIVEEQILVIRGQKVMLDKDLAMLYGVTTKALNQAVKRNAKRFPGDFMFKLTKLEKEEVVTICDHLKSIKFSPQLPYAFTEQGVAMLSSVLGSDRAVMVNIQIMRAFVSFRKMGYVCEEVKKKIETMEKRYDGQFRVVFTALKKLMEPPKEPKRTIGFTANREP